ncbi:MAG TPA: hypothetical protein VJJ47_01900 [Candidatus Paceibacterota bacterium]
MRTFHDPRDFSPSWPLLSVVPLLVSAALGLTAPLVVAALGAFLAGEWWGKNVRLRFSPASSPRFGTIGAVGAALAAICAAGTLLAARPEPDSWRVGGGDWAIVALALLAAALCLAAEVRRSARNGQPKPAVENDS